MSRQLAQPVMNDLLAMLEHYESLHDGKLLPNRLTPQMDAGGLWTEGYGQLVLDANSQPLKGYEHRSNALVCSKITNKEEALTALGIRLGQTVNALDNLTTGKLTDAQLAAVSDFAYNVGIGGFESSTIYRLLKAGTPENITFDNFKSWDEGTDMSGKKIIEDGLIARRASEWSMFTGKGFIVYTCTHEILSPAIDIETV